MKLCALRFPVLLAALAASVPAQTLPSLGSASSSLPIGSGSIGSGSIGGAFIGNPVIGNSPAAQEILRGNDDLATYRYADALRAYKHADELEHHACLPCLAGVSRAYLGMQDWKNALSAAERYLTKASDDTSRATGHILKGIALSGMIRSVGGDPTPAESELRTAADTPGADPLAHFYFGEFLLSGARDVEGTAELQKYVEQSSQGAMASLAQQWMEHPGRVRGTFSPEFHFTTESGDNISLAALKGKIVVLDFWATWCAACHDAVPQLRDLLKKYGDSDFELIGISEDQDPKAWRDYIGRERMSWPQYLDESGETKEMFAVEATPTYVVIAPDGAILARLVGTLNTKSISYRLKDILSKADTLTVARN